MKTECGDGRNPRLNPLVLAEVCQCWLSEDSRGKNGARLYLSAMGGHEP